MNTINNPIILKKRERNSADYTVNTHYSKDQSGEYVDKALAEEMLTQLIWARDWLEEQGHGSNDLDNIIIRAKGE